jgi:hypothetical protein
MDMLKANSIDPLKDSPWDSNPRRGIVKSFPIYPFKTPISLVFYSSFTPPALSGQMTGSVYMKTTLKYFISIGWTFEGCPTINLSLLLFTKVGNDNS